MKALRYTLLSDGSSDRALIPHLTWLLRSNGVNSQIDAEWAELRLLREIPQSLVGKIAKSIDLYPCDLLFIHRDAERATPEDRKQEVLNALKELIRDVGKPFAICVIPVRMQEAWLLFDEAAIRRASGNPNGRVRIELPKLKAIESLPDPKNTLHGLLKTASERTGRRLKDFNVRHSAGQVSQFIEDFSLLRRLSAFQTLEKDIREVIACNNLK